MSISSTAKLYEKKVVGPSETKPRPSVHLVIGNPSASDRSTYVTVPRTASNAQAEQACR